MERKVDKRATLSALRSYMYQEQVNHGQLTPKMAAYCAGRAAQKHGYIPTEEEVVAEARASADRFRRRNYRSMFKQLPLFPKIVGQHA